MLEIIIGTAEGLAHLHTNHSPTPDSRLRAKIADFGLARSFQEDQSHIRKGRCICLEIANLQNIEKIKKGGDAGEETSCTNSTCFFTSHHSQRIYMLNKNLIKNWDCDSPTSILSWVVRFVLILQHGFWFGFVDGLPNSWDPFYQKQTTPKFTQLLRSFSKQTNIAIILLVCFRYIICALIFDISNLLVFITITNPRLNCIQLINCLYAYEILYIE